MFATCANAYAAEVCPVVLRGYLTVYVDIAWIVGQLISAGVVDACQKLDTQWAYRIPFALQWIWPIPLMVMIFFAPESPWWCVRKKKYAEAERALLKLSTQGNGVDPQKTIAEIMHTQEIEREIESGVTYWDCFKGIDRRRTEIG